MAKRVLITGGSSGIGAALASTYIEEGATVYICGQNPSRLGEVASSCGQTLKTALVDVTDRQATESWIKKCLCDGPLDLVIANAGIAGDPARDVRENLERVFAVNAGGVFNTVFPAIEAMRGQADGGQIAIVSSIAGFRGMVSAAPYSASKAAVRVWAEGMRSELAAENIKLNVICPGFVRSRITDRNTFPMPMFMEADKAARIIKRGLDRNRGRIVFPLPMYIGIWFLYALPDWLIDRVTALGGKRFRK